MVRLKRAQPSSAMVVNGAVYLVDVGDGALRQLYAAGLKIDQVRGIFVTLHSQDRTSGLGAFLSTRWATNGKMPLAIHAPPGLTETLGGLRATLNPVAASSHGGSGKPLEDIAAHELSAPGIIYQDENVRVTALALPREGDVAGRPPRAFAYRFDTADGSIAFSGPTGPFDGLVPFLRNADTLVAEVINLPAARGEPISLPRGKTRGAGPAQPLPGHLNADQIGKIAAAAGVGRVILHHLIPSTDGESAKMQDWLYAAGVRASYAGPVIIPRDLETFGLKRPRR
jgi:ribonuclease BN (tRNA processing enzyme)